MFSPLLKMTLCFLLPCEKKKKRKKLCLSGEESAQSLDSCSWVYSLCSCYYRSGLRRVPVNSICGVHFRDRSVFSSDIGDDL